jgi:hypothetical protein
MNQEPHEPHEHTNQERQLEKGCSIRIAVEPLGDYSYIVGLDTE